MGDQYNFNTLTVDDIMAKMQWKDRDAVYRHVKAGRLKCVPGVRPFRFTWDAFSRFLNGPEDTPEPPRRRPTIASAPQTTKGRGSRFGRIGI